MSSQAPLPTDGSGYSYHSPTQYSPHSGLHEQPPLHLDAHMSVPQREAENYGGVESEPEGEVDQQGPPKKKRRRQALSCTECKRRKIKCDRSQPCGPCTRRGEQTKCQWHVVEPIEKYVTRAEYDELKRRFDSLEAVVNNLWSASTTTMSIPSYQMGMSSNMTAAPVTVPYPTAQPVSVYQSMMPPSTYPQHMDGSHRYTKTESPQDVSQSPRHQHAMQSGMPPPQTTSPIIQTTHPPNSMGRLRSPPNVKSPTSATKHSPLSLASITSPFNPESQSKNCNAQTLKLGERLRPGSQAHESSAALSNDRAHQEHQQPTRQISISKAQHHSISHKAHHHGATVTLHSSSPVSYHPGMTIGSV